MDVLGRIFVVLFAGMVLLMVLAALSRGHVEAFPCMMVVLPFGAVGWWAFRAGAGRRGCGWNPLGRECTRCGYEVSNRDGARFCPRCGARLDD